MNYPAPTSAAASTGTPRLNPSTNGMELLALPGPGAPNYRRDYGFGSNPRGMQYGSGSGAGFASPSPGDPYGLRAVGQSSPEAARASALAELERQGYKKDQLKTLRAEWHGNAEVMPPRWAEQPICHETGKPFGMMLRRHHCRNCGASVCADACIHSMAVPRLGFLKPVRVCNTCETQLHPFGSAIAQTSEWVNQGNGGQAQAALPAPMVFPAQQNLALTANGMQPQPAPGGLLPLPAPREAPMTAPVDPASLGQDVGQAVDHFQSQVDGIIGMAAAQAAQQAQPQPQPQPQPQLQLQPQPQSQPQPQPGGQVPEVRSRTDSAAAIQA